MPDDPAIRVTTRNATISLRAPGIVWIDYNAGAHDTIDDAVAHVEAQELLGRGEPRPTLIDIRAMSGIDKEARAYYTGDKAEHVNKATALVVKSRISRVIGSFFIGLNRPHRPTKLFTSPEDARAWLAEFL